MNLTQVDKDFLTIKDKLITENETFLKKFQHNKDYLNFKHSNNKSVFVPIILTFLFLGIVAAAIYFLNKYLPDYFVYEFVIGIALILLSIAILIAILTKKLKIEKSVNKNGFYNAIMQIETSYDKLISFMQGYNAKTMTDEEKVIFYENLAKIFGNVANKLSKTYTNKTEKIKKLNSKNLDWPWLIKYLYNFGKFCFNKKQDCKTFVKLMSL